MVNHIITNSEIIYPAFTFLGLLVIFFMRTPKIIKLLGSLAFIYSATAIFHHEYLQVYLGVSAKPVAVLCLIVTLLACLISFLGFLRAGVTIAFWTGVTFIIVGVAFPEISIANFTNESSKNVLSIQETMENTYQTLSSGISDLWSDTSRASKR